MASATIARPPSPLATTVTPIPIPLLLPTSFTLIELSELGNLSRLLHLLYHRNKNQHRRALWWRHFNIFRREFSSLLGEIVEVAAVAARTGSNTTKKAEKKGGKKSLSKKKGDGVEEDPGAAVFAAVGIIGGRRREVGGGGGRKGKTNGNRTRIKQTIPQTIAAVTENKTPSAADLQLLVLTRRAERERAQKIRVRAEARWKLWVDQRVEGWMRAFATTIANLRFAQLGLVLAGTLARVCAILGVSSALTQMGRNHVLREEERAEAEKRAKMDAAAVQAAAAVMSGQRQGDGDVDNVGIDIGEPVRREGVEMKGKIQTPELAVKAGTKRSRSRPDDTTTFTTATAVAVGTKGSSSAPKPSDIPSESPAKRQKRRQQRPEHPPAPTSEVATLEKYNDDDDASRARLGNVLARALNTKKKKGLRGATASTTVTTVTGSADNILGTPIGPTSAAIPSLGAGPKVSSKKAKPPLLPSSLSSSCKKDGVKKTKSKKKALDDIFAAW